MIIHHFSSRSVKHLQFLFQGFAFFILFYFLLTSDVQSEVYTRISCRQTETHDDEDGGVRRDTNQHPKHHRQGQGGQQSLGPAQPAEEHTYVLKQPERRINFLGVPSTRSHRWVNMCIMKISAPIDSP